MRTLLIAAALFIAVPAHADGLLVPPYGGPPPPPLWGAPMGPVVQEPPRQSCVETAIQLGYQTGNPRVGIAGVEACRIYAPIRPAYIYGPPPLGGFPSPRPWR